MPEQKVYTDAQVNKLIQAVTDKQIAGFIEAINKGKTAHEMSEATSKRFDKLEKTISNLHDKLGCSNNGIKISKMYCDLYGDKDDDSDIGLKSQVDYIYRIVIGAKGAGFAFKLMVALVAGLALLGGTILSFKFWILNK